jgi:hypothetical protein
MYVRDLVDRYTTRLRYSRKEDLIRMEIGMSRWIRGLYLKGKIRNEDVRW